jgi:hypothetical protein
VSSIGCADTEPAPVKTRPVMQTIAAVADSDERPDFEKNRMDLSADQ